MAVDNMKKKAKRKPGGGRKPSKPDYNPSAILQNQMDTAVALYDKEEHPSLQTIADELDLNPIKVRKLLITAGVYKSDVADQVQKVFGTHRKAGLSPRICRMKRACTSRLRRTAIISASEQSASAG